MTKVFRKTFTIMTCLMFAGALFAADIIGTGTGSTKDEALKNARLDCQSQISINISAVTVAESHDDGNSRSASMSQYSYQYTTFEIIGAKEEVSLSNGVYTARTIIPEKAATLYEIRVKDLLNETNARYKALQGKEETASVNELGQLFVTVRNFETYRTVLQKLDPDNPYSTQAAAITKGMAETMYRNRLMQEQNLQEQTIEDLNTRIRIGMADAETQRQLEKVKKEYEATLAEQKSMQEQSIKEQELRFAEFEQMTIAAMENNAKRTGAIDDATNTLLSSRLNSIEANRKTLEALKEKLTKELDDLESEMRGRKALSNYEITGMPYSESDYINGTLTQEARRYRETLKSNAAKEIENEYRLLETTLIERYVLSMEELTAKTEELVQELLGTEYSFSTGDPGVSVKCDGMYLDNGIISFTLSIVLGDRKVDYYYTIGYADITGKPKPAMSSSEYSLYRNQLTQIYDILKNCPDFYPVTVKVAVKFDGSSKYSCRMTGCDIYMDVEKGIKAKSSFNRSQEEYISFGGSFEFGNYKWISDHATLVDGESVAEKARLQYRTQSSLNAAQNTKGNGANGNSNSKTQQTSDAPKKTASVRKADYRAGKGTGFLEFVKLDGGKYENCNSINPSFGLTFWKNDNIYHSVTMTLEDLPQIRYSYIDENRKINETSTLGIFFGYAIGASGPVGGILKVDATAGIKIGGQDYVQHDPEEVRDYEHAHTKYDKFAMSADLTCGLTLRLGDPYKMGLQIRGFGIISFNTAVGIRKGFGINIHFAPFGD